MRDEAGFTAFVAARGPALLRLGWLLTADADAGQDLAQEALTRLVRHRDRRRPGGSTSTERSAARPPVSGEGRASLEDRQLTRGK